jgi:spore maturation protein CgeB
MSRILVVQPGPDFSVSDVFRGWVKALRKQGHQIMVYNTNELVRLTFYARALLETADSSPCEHCGRPDVHLAMPDPAMMAQMATKGLMETCFEFWPDVVFFVSAFYQTGQALATIRARNMKIVMLHTESPYQDDEQKMRGQFANLNLLNDPTNIESWKGMGIPAAYVPHSYDPGIHFPPERRDYSVDFSFVGTAFRSRLEFFSAMNFDGIDTVLGGNGWDSIEPEFLGLLKYLGHQPDECVDNTETARVYRMTKAGINFYRRESEDAHKGEGYAMGPREIEMAACGLFFLRDPRPESDLMFDGILPKFHSPQEAEESLRWWLKHDSAREEMADKARAAIADWTFDNRAAEIMKLMEKEGIM